MLIQNWNYGHDNIDLVQWSRLSIWIKVSTIIISDQIKIYYFSYIGYYSTASTPDAAYIIGGYYQRTVVAEFKDDQWNQLGSLNKGRYAHGSLSVGDQTIIVGGDAESGK